LSGLQPHPQRVRVRDAAAGTSSALTSCGVLPASRIAAANSAAGVSLLTRISFCGMSTSTREDVSAVATAFAISAGAMSRSCRWREG